MVSLERIRPFVSGAEIGRLEELFPDGGAAAWGVTPGQDSQGRGKWERMDPGDLALFAKEGRAGVVQGAFHGSRSLRVLAADYYTPQTSLRVRRVKMLAAARRVATPTQRQALPKRERAARASGVNG